MVASVWLLNYDIAAGDRDHYLSWFHDNISRKNGPDPVIVRLRILRPRPAMTPPVYTAISACLAAIQQRCF